MKEILNWMQFRVALHETWLSCDITLQVEWGPSLLFIPLVIFTNLLLFQQYNLVRNVKCNAAKTAYQI
jgi:hypothetical protein